MDTPLVNVGLASKATGLNRYFLYRLAAQKKLPHYRAGKAVRFSIPELLAWMRTNVEAKTNGSGKNE